MFISYLILLFCLFFRTPSTLSSPLFNLPLHPQRHSQPPHTSPTPLVRVTVRSRGVRRDPVGRLRGGAQNSRVRGRGDAQQAGHPRRPRAGPQDFRHHLPGLRQRGEYPPLPLSIDCF